MHQARRKLDFKFDRCRSAIEAWSRKNRHYCCLLFSASFLTNVSASKYVKLTLSRSSVICQSSVLYVIWNISLYHVFQFPLHLISQMINVNFALLKCFENDNMTFDAPRARISGLAPRHATFHQRVIDFEKIDNRSLTVPRRLSRDLALLYIIFTVQQKEVSYPDHQRIDHKDICLSLQNDVSLLCSREIGKINVD